MSELKSLLTAKDVHERRFSTHRFVSGYDIDEVDGLLEEVETTLAKLGATIQSIASRNHDLEVQLQVARVDAARLRLNAKGK